MVGNLPQQREPPQNLEAERSVLGSILLDPTEALATVQALGLEAGHFHSESHRVIYRAMIRLTQRGSPVDLVTLTEGLRTSGELDRGGGVTYLTGVADFPGVSSNVKSYARIVLDHARRRELVGGAQQLQSLALQGEDGWEDEARELLRQAAVPGGERLRIRNDWATSEPSARAWLCPGWLPLGRVALLTGPGSVGKSLLALQLAVTVASGQGVSGGSRTDALPIMAGAGKEGPAVDSGHAGPAVVVGWEDEADEVARRLRLLPGAAAGPRLPSALHYVDLAGRGPLWAPREGRHRDTGLTLTRVGHQLERLLEDVQPRLLVLDPVAAAYAGNENDRAAVRSFLAYLNDLAAGLEVAVLIVAHPPKASEERYSGSTDWRNGVRALWTLGVQDVPGWEGSDTERKRPARGYALELDKSNYSRAGTRAWLRFRVDSDPDGSAKRLAWEAVSAGEAAGAYHHRFREWGEPQQKGGGRRPNGAAAEKPSAL